MSTLKANTIQPINAATGLVLRTNEVDRLNINTSGDVGIGVSPSYKLHVSGTCAIVPNTNVGMRIYEDGDSANFLRFRPLSSTGSQTGFMFSGDDDSPHLTINYTSLVSGSPRIGIGTASPTVALDVNGDIKSSTYVRATSGMVIGGATFDAPTGTAPLFGARAWALFNSSGLISGRNITNVIRYADGNGKPYYRFFFTNQPPSALYCVTATHNNHAGYGVSCSTIISAQQSYTEFRFYVSGSETDPSYGCVVWFW